MIDSQPCPVVYSGSPLAYSFAEANQDKYVFIIEAEINKPVHYTPIQLIQGKPLIRKRFDDIQQAVDWLIQNPDVWVELTIVSENYLTAIDRKLLYDSHKGIVTLIPEISSSKKEDNNENSAIDLSKNMDELFIDFFKNKKGGQAPNERLLSLYKEIIAEDEQ
jgi:exonuclease SbcD